MSVKDSFKRWLETFTQSDQYFSTRVSELLGMTRESSTSLLISSETSVAALIEIFSNTVNEIDSSGQNHNVYPRGNFHRVLVRDVRVFKERNHFEDEEIDQAENLDNSNQYFKAGSSVIMLTQVSEK